jgi:hypothetical protein
MAVDLNLFFDAFRRNPAARACALGSFERNFRDNRVDRCEEAFAVAHETAVAPFIATAVSFVSA